MADRIGQQLGNYTLIRPLGEGGFAEVYLGEHIHLGTQAAIKILHTQLSSENVDEFRAEARTIARLIHPNIVRVLEFGIEVKTPFLVMDFAPNGTLRQKHPKGTILPLPTIVPYVKQVADALQYAHDEKLIHRDIKPENMLIGRRGEILLSDFGIALVAQSSRYQSTKEMAGTMAYMAPEQIQGKPRPASDQYALGIVVYEWLSGERPFHGSFTEIVAQHLAIPPTPLREKVEAVSPAVQEVVMTALAKEPKQRFGSVQAFANALQQASQPDAPTFVKPITIKPTVPVVQPPRVEAPSKPITNTPSFPPTEIAVSIAKATVTPPLPPTEVVVPSRPVGTTLYIYQGHSASVSAVAWSPDGKYIASGGDDNTVQVWDAVTRNLFFTYPDHLEAVNSIAWSPDGIGIASGSSDGTVQVWDAVPRDRLFTYRGHLKIREVVWAVAWSPDGEYIAAASDDKTVQVWKVSSRKKVFTYRGHSNWVNTVSWSPDGEYIASGDDDGIVQVWECTAGYEVVTYSDHLDVVGTVSWSPDGKYIASGSDDGAVQIWECTTGRKIITYAGHSNAIGTVKWSPDGKYIASGDDDGIVQVWKAIAEQKLITYSGHSGSVYELAWSPDGKLIASASTDKTVQVWVAPRFR